MKVVRDADLGTVTLIPVEEEEASILTTISQMLKPEDRLDYRGRSWADPDEKIMVLALRVDTINLVLRGSTDEDNNMVHHVRRALFHGAEGGLIFLGAVEVDGKTSLVTTIGRCQHCDRNVARSGECEWKTCYECSGKCEHEYVNGIVHGVTLGIDDFCKKCGRVKPKPVAESAQAPATV